MPIGRVAGEAAAEVVVDPAGGHGVEGQGDGPGHLVTSGAGRGQQEHLQHGRLGELGGPPETAPFGVVGGDQGVGGRRKETGWSGALDHGPARKGGPGPHGVRQLGGRLVEVAPPLVPRPR